MQTSIALPKKITDIVDEYNEKLSNIGNALEKFEQAKNDLLGAATVSGTNINTTVLTIRK